MSQIQVRITDIPGESTIAGYQDQIDCLAMRHAIDLPVVATGATRTEGASSHGAIELQHSLDRASPALRHAASAGTNVGTVAITRLRMAGGQTSVAETVTLKDAYVVRVDVETPIDPTTNEPAEEPMETFHLEYSEITWEQRSADQATVSGGWSTATQAIV